MITTVQGIFIESPYISPILSSLLNQLHINFIHIVNKHPALNYLKSV